MDKDCQNDLVLEHMMYEWLREMNSSSLKRRRTPGDKAAFIYLEEVCKVDRPDFSVVLSSR